jgi:hypothetical protein
MTAERRHSGKLAAAVVTAAALACACRAAGAAEEAGEPQPENKVAWKFTPTWHNNSSQPNAWDFNLRGNTDTQTWWVGYYQRSDEFQQARLGYERPTEFSFGRIVPSFQYASRGFLGGSLYGEIGGDWFAILGWGRTNLKDYYNLNFDPNDAVTFGAGTRVVRNTTLSLYQVRDDRLDTGQRITHAVARWKPDEKTRWTVDVFYKEGRPDSDPASERIRGTGVAVTYDFDPYFVRVASDPHVNFSDNNMVRLAIGFRF